MKIELKYYIPVNHHSAWVVDEAVKKQPLFSYKVKFGNALFDVCQ